MNLVLDRKLVKEMARKKSRIPEFKASKGWMDKFLQRSQIQEQVAGVLRHRETSDHEIQEQLDDMLWQRQDLSS